MAEAVMMSSARKVGRIAAHELLYAVSMGAFTAGSSSKKPFSKAPVCAITSAPKRFRNSWTRPVTLGRGFRRRGSCGGASMNGAAIVTGAGQGMGRSFALRLARDGYAIAAVDVQGEKVRETAALVMAEQGTARAYIADLSDVSAIEPLVEKIERDLGVIEILVNNAGTIKTQLLLDVTEQDWDQIMGVNASRLVFSC